MYREELNRLIKDYKYKDTGYMYDEHYVYTDKDNNPIAAKILYKNKEGKKTTIILRIIENNNTYKLSLEKPHGVLLYNAHGINNSQSKTLFIVNDEKDVESFNSLGFVATCSIDNTKWRQEYSKIVFNKFDYVNIVENKDFTDTNWVETVVGSIRKEVGGLYSLDKSLKVLRHPNNCKEFSVSKYVDFLMNHQCSQDYIKNCIFKLSHVAENMLSVHELHQDGQGIYKLKTVADKEGNIIDANKEYIAEFNVIDAKDIVVIYDDNDTVASIELHLKPTMKVSDGKEVFKFVLKGKHLLKVDEFNDIITCKSNQLAFEGSSNDMKRLRKYIVNYYAHEKEILHAVGGIKKIDDSYYFIAEDGALNSQGEFFNDIKCLEQDFNKAKIYNTKSVTSGEFKELLIHLINFNTKVNVVNILGTALSFFLRHVFSENGIKVPDIFIFGSAGSGKNETVDRIIKPLFNLKSGDNILNLGGTNTTALPVKLAGTHNNTIPVVYNEIGNASPHIKSVLYSVFKAAYDRESISKGKIDYNVDKFKFVSPLIAMGETSFSGASQEETALKRRHAIITMSKAQLNEENTESYRFLVENEKLLNALGKELLITSLNIESELLDYRFELREKLAEYKFLKDSILDIALATIVGFWLLAKSLKKYDILLNDYITEEEILRYVIENIKTQNLNGGERLKTQLDKHIEILLATIIDKQVTDENLWKVDIKKDILFIAHEIVANSVIEKAKKLNKINMLLSQSDLENQATLDDYVYLDKSGKMDTSPRKFSSSYSNSRMWKFKISKIKNLDIFKDVLLFRGIDLKVIEDVDTKATDGNVMEMPNKLIDIVHVEKITEKDLSETFTAI